MLQKIALRCTVLYDSTLQVMMQFVSNALRIFNHLLLYSSNRYAVLFIGAIAEELLLQTFVLPHVRMHACCYTTPTLRNKFLRLVYHTDDTLYLILPHRRCVASYYTTPTMRCILIYHTDTSQQVAAFILPHHAPRVFD